MTAITRILVAHPSSVKADALCQSLGRMHRAYALTRSSSGEETLELVNSAAIDVVLIDAEVNAVVTIRAIKATRPGQRVIVLGLDDQSNAILPMIEAGATGYIPGDASLNDIGTLIEAVLRDRPVCSPQIVAAIFERVWQLSQRSISGGLGAESLSRREQEILRLIGSGLTNKEIALQLGLETCTVKNHVHHILEKLKVHRRQEAVRQAVCDPPVRDRPSMEAHSS